MELKKAVENFKKVLDQEGVIRVITHIDTDGITSAAILIRALKKLDQQFLVSFVRQLEESYIKQIYEETKHKKWKAVFFLDLGSGSLSKLANLSKYTKVIILDHHEIQENFIVGEALENLQSENFIFVNPLANNYDLMSASCVTYLFVKEIDESNKELAQIAVVGLIGDLMEKTLNKTTNEIINDAKKVGLEVKKGIVVFSPTRPIHKAIEFGSNLFIPGVTGSWQGSIDFLKELGIEIKDKTRGTYRTLLDLTKEELSKLITGIVLKTNLRNEDIIGNIYLLKLFGRIYDARELSAMINACGRLDHASLALAFLLNSKEAKEKIEKIYAEYRHHLINGLNFVMGAKKIESYGYVIINGKDKIKDTIIGTIVSILANSSFYPAGTIIVGMAYRNEKIKVSARISGKNINSANLYKILNPVARIVGGEAGGHANAAGAIIPIQKEQEFISLLEQALKIEEIKIKI